MANTGKSALDFLQRFVTQCTKKVGEGIYTLSHELIPVRGVKDVFMFQGHILQGGTFSNYQPSWKKNHSRWDSVGSFEPGELPSIIHCCGMMTSNEDAIAVGQSISIRLENRRVDVFHPATNGLVGDLISCTLNY